jgi:hypothetical protein
VTRPNFFVIGAPKCGTTSLSRWLRGHPNIYMPFEKEPGFFNSDDRRAISALDQYEGLFRDAREEHIAVGEASVFYLSSSVAATNIIRYQPEARFIVMVRNPVEMAPAFHAEMVLSGQENVRDFYEAWNLQKARRHGHRLPIFCGTRRYYLYEDLCSLGQQVQKLLAIVPASRVLVIVLDDVASDPRKEYLRVLNFLGVPDDGRLSFPIYNTARVSRRPKLLRLLYLVVESKRLLGISVGFGLWSRVKAGQIEQKRPDVSAEVAEILNKSFANDVGLLSQLLNRDLQHWVVTAPAAI